MLDGGMNVRGRSRSERLWAMLVMSVCIVVACSAVAASVDLEPASAEGDGSDVGGIGSLVAEHSGLCLDVAYASADDGAAVVQWRCHGRDNQLFERVPAAGGFMLRAVHSGKCLGTRDGSTDLRAPLQQGPCTGAPEMVFGTADSSLIFKHSGRCVDVGGRSRDGGASVIQWDCHGGDNQQFRFDRVDGDDGTDGGGNQDDGAPVGSLVAEHSGLCLTVPASSTENGVIVEQRSCAGADSQRFKQVTVDGGFQLRAVHSGKCLGARGASTNNSTELHQWDCADTPDMVFTWSGRSLVLDHADKCLDVSGWSGREGADVVQYDCHGGTNQRFRFDDSYANGPDMGGRAPVEFRNALVILATVVDHGREYTMTDAEIELIKTAWTKSWVGQMDALGAGMIKNRNEVIVYYEPIRFDRADKVDCPWPRDIPGWGDLVGPTGRFDTVGIYSKLDCWAFASGHLGGGAGHEIDGVQVGHWVSGFRTRPDDPTPYLLDSGALGTFVHEWMHVISDGLYKGIHGIDAPCVHCDAGYEGVSWRIFYRDTFLGRIPRPDGQGMYGIGPDDVVKGSIRDWLAQNAGAQG